MSSRRQCVLHGSAMPDPLSNLYLHLLLFFCPPSCRSVPLRATQTSSLPLLNICPLLAQHHPTVPSSSPLSIAGPGGVGKSFVTHVIVSFLSAVYGSSFDKAVAVTGSLALRMIRHTLISPSCYDDVDPPAPARSSTVESRCPAVTYHPPAEEANFNPPLSTLFLPSSRPLSNRAPSICLEHPRCQLSSPALSPHRRMKCRPALPIPIVSAPTGIAATHIGGTTVHSAFGLGVPALHSDFERRLCGWGGRGKAMAAQLRVLLIDEISMLAGEFLDLLDMAMRKSVATYGRGPNREFRAHAQPLEPKLYCKTFTFTTRHSFTLTECRSHMRLREFHSCKT